MTKTFILFYLLLAIVFIARAAGENLSGPANPATAGNPSQFVLDFYNFSLAIGGILAFGSIVYGGIKYTFARGNPTAQGDGKDWIKSALLGLLLLAGSYLVLKTINPQLISLNIAGLPGLPEAQAPTSGGGGSGGSGSSSGGGSTDPVCVGNQGICIWTLTSPNLPGCSNVGTRYTGCEPPPHAECFVLHRC